MNVKTKQMNRTQIMKQVSLLDKILKDAGLEDVVNTRVEFLENGYGKKEAHIVAELPAVKAVAEGVFEPKVDFKIEALNKWFSLDVFALGITQRADYLKADFDTKVECYNKVIHPAAYKA